ncbi:hypothetical protein BU17DRAFT_69014 [Hysterangium stoloniferum]|nr:hypothetical protein BU17DRAFT_69014 [Hysterangium stoloniferum]
MALTASRGHYLHNLTLQQLNVQVDTEQLIWVLWKILKGEGNELAAHTPNSLSEMVVRPDFSEASVFLSNQSTITPHYPTNRHPNSPNDGPQRDITFQHMGTSNLNNPGLDNGYPSPIARPSSNNPLSTLTPLMASDQSRYVIPAHRPAPSPSHSQISPDRAKPSSSAFASADDIHTVDSSAFHIPYTEGWSVRPEAAWVERTQGTANKSPQYISHTVDPRQARPSTTRGSSLLTRSPGIIGSGRPSSRGSSDTSSELSLGSHASSIGFIGDSRQVPGANLRGPQVIHETPHARGHTVFHTAPASSLRSWNSAPQPTSNYQGLVGIGRNEMGEAEKRSDGTTGDLLQELTKLSLQHGRFSPRAPVMPKSQPREDFEYVTKCQQPTSQHTYRSSSSGQGLGPFDTSVSSPKNIVASVARNSEASTSWISSGATSSNDATLHPSSAMTTSEGSSAYHANVAESILREDSKHIRHLQTLQVTPSEGQPDAVLSHTPIQQEADNTLPIRPPQASHKSTFSMSLSGDGSTQLTQPSSSVISKHESPTDAQDVAKERDELTTAIILFLTARERVLTLSERRKLQPYLVMLTQPLCILRPNDIPSLVAKNQDIAVNLLTLLLDREDSDMAKIEQVIKNAERNGEDGEDAGGFSRNCDSLAAISTAVNFVNNYGFQSSPTADDVSPLGGQAAKEKYLTSLRDLPPTMQSFNVIGRLLRPSHPASTKVEPSEDSATRVASLVRVEVLGGFVSGCVRWIEQAEKDEKEGLVHDNRVAISTANLCRFYTSLIKMGFVAADSEVDTAEIMRFALQFSRLDEARSLYSILAAARA